MKIVLPFFLGLVIALSGCTGYLTAENAVTSGTGGPPPSPPSDTPAINLSCSADDVQNCGPSCGQRCGSYCVTVYQTYGAPVQALCREGACGCVCQCASGWTGLI